MSQQDDLDELFPAFTPLAVIKEALRCLLCHNAPCSRGCPAQTGTANLFALCISVISLIVGMLFGYAM